MEVTIKGWALEENNTLCFGQRCALNTTETERADGMTVIQKIKQYGVIILVIFGLVFNTLSFAVFWVSRLRKTSQGQYLLALSVSDNLVLITEIIIWLKSLDVYWLDHSDAMCRLTYTLRYAGRLWSALLVTTITIERYCFIVHPFKTNAFFTLLPAKIVCVATCVLSHVFSLYAIFTLKLELADQGSRRVCAIPINMRVPFTVCDLIFSRGIADIVTGLLIVVFTSLIVKHLINVRRHRKKELQLHNLRQITQRQFQLTIMLLALAVSFILLKVPYTIAWYSRFLMKMSHPNGGIPDSIDAAISLTYVFTVMTYSINFVFYVICGSSYRDTLNKLIHCQTEAINAMSYTSVLSNNNGRSNSLPPETSV